MYINDTHIGFYVVAAIVGLLVGQFVDWVNKRLPENKKILTTDLFREYKIDFRPNYILTKQIFQYINLQVPYKFCNLSISF